MQVDEFKKKHFKGLELNLNSQLKLDIFSQAIDTSKINLSTYNVSDAIKSAKNYLRIDLNTGELEPTGFENSNNTTLTALCFLDSQDAFTATRAESNRLFIEKIVHVDQILQDSHKLIITAWEMNHLHRSKLNGLFNLIDKAYLNYNNNIKLGRNASISLKILFNELKQYNIFKIPKNFTNREYLLKLKRIGLEIESTIRAIDSGNKVHTRKIAELTRSLEKRLAKCHEEEYQYWYNPKTLLDFIDNTLFPQALLNTQEKINQNFDKFKIVKEFLRKVLSNGKFQFFIPLLFQPFQTYSTRYATNKDFSKELEKNEFKAIRYPDLSHRFEQKRLKIKLVNDTTKIASLIKRPFIRIAYSHNYIPELLYNIYKNTDKSALKIGTLDKLQTWTKNSFFSIDPFYGIPSLANSTILALVTDKIVERIENKKLSNNDIKPSEIDAFFSDKLIYELNTVFHKIIDGKINDLYNRIDTILSILNNKDKDKNSLFEIKEIFVDLLFSGVVQCNSEWHEEQEIEMLFDNLSRLTGSAERNDSYSLKELGTYLPKLKEATKALQARSNQIKIDRESLIIWFIMVLYIPSRINKLSLTKFINAKESDVIIFPINTPAYIENLTPTSKKLLQININNIISQI